MKPLKTIINIALLALCLTGRAADYPLNNPGFSDGLTGWNSSLKGVEVSFSKGGATLNITEKPQSPWKLQIRQIVKTACYPGETIELRAKISSDSGQELALGLQSTKPPFGSVVFTKEPASAEPSWITIRGKADQLMPSGESQLTLTCGFGTGNLTIHHVELHFPERANMADVPATFQNLQWAEEDLPQIALEKYPLPEKGTLPAGPFRSIIAGVSGLELQGKKWATLEPRTVQGQPFTNSVVLTTQQATPKIYTVQARQDLVYPARKGDVMLALFSVRMVEPNPQTGYAALMFALEEIGGRYEKLFQWGETLHDGEWRHVIAPFRLKKDIAAGAAQVVLRAGFGPQSVEIGQTALINLGPDAKPWGLKKSRMTYGGEAPDAAWRADATARIETHRKGDFTLSVPGAAEVPIIGKLIRHHFPFGSTLNSKVLHPDGEKYKPDYAPTAAKTFNCGSLENAMKWVKEHEPDNEKTIDEGLRWMEEKDWHIRGHVMIWPSWKHSPAALKNLKNQPEALRKEILDRITRTATRWRGRIDDWDVINEPFTNHDFMDLLGMEEMHAWMRAARAGAPNAKLYINDFDLIVRPGSGNPKIPYHLDLLNDLVANDVPIDGFGIQSHFVGILTPIEHVLSMLDTFAETGIDTQITELTINVPDEITQARYARDFITAAFSHPSVNLIQTWGFWEGKMFEPPAAMFRWNWDPKPLHNKWDELLNQTFSTSVSATTGTDGTLSFRGFYGTYEFELPGGRTVQATFTPDTPDQTL